MLHDEAMTEAAQAVLELGDGVHTEDGEQVTVYIEEVVDGNDETQYTTTEGQEISVEELQQVNTYIMVPHKPQQVDLKLICFDQIPK